MKPKRAVRELEKQLRKDPDNLVVRLRLAAALREVGKTARAVELYRSVAAAYHASGRFSQAMAVCKSVLEIDPSQRETQLLLADIETRVRTRAAQEAQAVAAASQRAHTAGEASRVRRASGVPPLRRKRSSQGPPSSDFSGRSGLTPASDELPSLARGGARSPGDSAPSPAQAKKSRSSDRLIASGSRPPGVRSSRRVQVFRDSEPEPQLEGDAGSSTRPSFGITPLPAPLASHEVDSQPSIEHPPVRDRVVRGAERVPPPLPTPTPTPAPARGGRSERHAGPPPPPPPRPPPPRPPAQPPRPPAGARRDAARQVDDDAPTTIAAESTWRPSVPGAAAPVLDDDPARDPPRAPASPPRGPAAPARTPSPRPVFDEKTRLGDSLAAAGEVGDDFVTERNALASLRELADDEGGDGPTNPGYQRPGAPDDPDTMTTNPRLDPAVLARERARQARERATLPAVPNPRVAPSGGSVPPSQPDDDYDPTRIEDPVAFGGPEVDDATATEEIPRVDLEALAGAPRDLDDGPSHDNIRLPSAFERSFEPVLSELTPDGAVVDVPRNLFAELPDDAVAELVRRMVLRRFDADDIVIREGDPGEACYVIASGAVRVMKRDPAPDRAEVIEVARLGPGAVFGEFALLADRRRHATVQAVEDSELYEIPRRALRELAANYPGVGPALERFYRQRLLSTLLATAPFLAPLPDEQRAELLARFVPRHCSSGQEVVREGQAAGGLYLIVLGSVEITKRVPRQRAVVLATLGEGTYFGELSLMRGNAAQATVTATGPTELAVLPPKDFYDIVASNPVLWEQMRREARRRELAIAEIIAGESGSV